jgi:hypothetical protein
MRYLDRTFLMLLIGIALALESTVPSPYHIV